MQARGARESRTASVICSLKGLLSYASEVLKVPVMDLGSIRVPRIPHREVTYLTDEELGRFISAIPLSTSWEQPRLSGFCFRALVETLAASGMRISEALSLDWDGIDFGAREARIVGKGNKERSVFFTERALDWIRQYIEMRQDSGPALFATFRGDRMGVSSVEAMFRRISRQAKLGKRVTPHTLRHTAATNLLNKGCPIGFIKEVLGHQKLETTCQFYLGVAKKADVKKAFETYMTYDVESGEQPPGAPPPSTLVAN